MSELDSGSNDMDRALEVDEIMAFADQVIWPAISHLYSGINFRERAKRKKTRISRKSRRVQTDETTEIITIEAESDPRTKTIDLETGETAPVCTAVIRIDELLSEEFRDGIIEVVEQDLEDIDEGDKWWEDSEVDWKPWDGRTFYFRTNPISAFAVYSAVEVHDDYERTRHDRLLWVFDDEDQFMPLDEVPIEEVDEDDREEEIDRREEAEAEVEAREIEFIGMLTLRECLEIRGALMRFGVPAEVLKLAN